MLPKFKRIPLIPACYFPTTIVVIDDNESLLQSLQLLFSKYFLVRLFQDPEKALDFLNHKYKPDPFLRRCFTHTAPTFREPSHPVLNVYTIQDEVYNPDRFEQISAVVSDHAMPGKTGMQLCRQIEQHAPSYEASIRRLILTGEAGHEVAVSGFYDGIINAFYKKSDPNVFEEVKKKLKLFERQYFEDNSLGVMNHLAHDPENRTTCLTNEKFIAFMESFIEEKNFCEYYILDPQASFVFYDADGHCYFLLVRNEKGTENSLKLAQKYGASQAVIDSIKNYQKILYVPDENLLKSIDKVNWDQYLYPAKLLEGANIHYSFIENVAGYVPKSKILSVNQYRRIMSS